MGLLELKTTDSLDLIWNQLVFTEARLLADGRAKDLATPFTALIARAEQVQQGQKGMWRNEIRADAAVAAADDALDDHVTDFSRNLLFVLENDRTHARFGRYFNRPPNELVHLGLESELSLIRSWPGSIDSEPEPQVKAFGPLLRAAIVDGDAALTQRTTAVSARQDHRAREIEALVADANALRKSTHATLEDREAKNGLPKGWAERFFMHKSKAAAPAEPPAPTPKA